MRVLALGNSHVGALLAGWRAVRERFPQFEFAFIGSHSKELRKATVDGGNIANVHFRQGGESLGIADYDAFVVVVDLLPLRIVFDRILKGAYSRQVTQAAIDDHVTLSLSLDIVNRLIRPTSHAPIFMLSRPERQSDQRKITQANWDSARQFLSEALARRGVVFVPQARSTLDAEFVPKPEFYSNAVNLGGRPASQQETASVGHLNAEGGRQAMLGVIASLEQAAPRA